MSENLKDLFTQQYSASVALLLQEQGYKLRGLVMTGSHVGLQASPVNQVGAISMRNVETRFTPKTHTHPVSARRWVYPTDKTVDIPIDNFDVLKTIVDVQSPYVQSATLAAGRAMDDAIIDAAFATSKIGETGSDTETFDTTNFSIAVNFKSTADDGLSVPKLIESNRKFMAANVDLDMEPPTLVVGPQQEADLLSQTQVTSTDYNNRPVLVEGRVRTFMGYRFIISNRLSLVSGDRACIAFVKSGLYLGIWQDVRSNVHQRHDLEADPWEITTTMSVGATRLEQGRVIRILCNE